MREFLEKNYTDEAIETDDLTIKLVIKALLEVRLHLKSGAWAEENRRHRSGQLVAAGVQATGREALRACAGCWALRACSGWALLQCCISSSVQPEQSRIGSQSSSESADEQQQRQDGNHWVHSAAHSPHLALPALPRLGN